MADSTVSVYNMALGWLGGDQLPTSEAAWDDSDPIGRLCKNLFPEVLRQCLEAHEWSFAAKSETLARKPEAAREGWMYRCALPSDCLRPLRLEGCGLPLTGPAFIIEGIDILCNVDPARMLYIGHVQDPKRWPPTFTSALSWGLASILATANNNDQRVQQNCLQRHQMALEEAWALDQQTQNEPPQPSAWAQARYGSFHPHHHPWRR